MRLRAIALTVVVIAAIWMLAQFVNPILAARNDERTMVTKVIDGDSIVTEGGKQIRLLGIDADERGRPCYEEATAWLEELVLNKEVRLEEDGRNQDKYKRYLRWVWLGNTLINEEIVAEGFAVARTNDGGKYVSRIKSAEKRAEENQIGCKWQD